MIQVCLHWPEKFPIFSDSGHLHLHQRMANRNTQFKLGVVTGDDGMYE